MSVLELKTDNFEQAISGDKAILVDFFAEWCGPCKMQTPVLHKVAEEYADKMGFGAVNVDDCEDIAAKYGVQSIPTLLVFKSGEVVKRAEGMKNEAQLKEWLKEYL
ncbi:thioredoxin [Brachyspira alvinipulli]|uniref:thioredoxin n=1 Tax=Brachyspira alvinipulli TaxID=84379 RepID=UPI00262B1BBB|nr:thioredoxin [uncultured Brachyspira sp.]